LVKAPLPGVITAIFVQADQPVRCGQDLCSIETMKMNNVIQAPVDGVVGRVWVSQGQAVNFEEPLVEIRG
jgi:biotin carboxyl carrier protein